MGSLAILGGHVVDPRSGIDDTADVFITEGKVVEVKESAGGHGGPPLQGPTAINAAGCFVIPGLIDLHVHLRTPGEEDKEDPASGGRAAAKGSFTTICCMPNTRPALDSPGLIEQLLARCERECPVRVLPFAALTEGNEGKRLTDFAALKQAGAAAISDDGHPLQDSSLAFEAFRRAAKQDILLALHSEDLHLAGSSGPSPLAPRPSTLAVAEEVMLARNILFAAETGARLHLCHLTTSGGVALLRWAKEQGLAAPRRARDGERSQTVTAEACPHHLLLNEESVRQWGPVAKVKPPLRPEKERLALLEAVREGLVDVIATDHAPHLWEEKHNIGGQWPVRRQARDGEQGRTMVSGQREWELETRNPSRPGRPNGRTGSKLETLGEAFEQAPSGIVGLETALSLVYTHLGIGMPEIVRLMATRPAEILGLADRGHLGRGACGDVVIFDPERTWKIEGERFLSKAKFTPFEGWEVKGEVVATIVGGKVVYESRV